MDTSALKWIYCSCKPAKTIHVQKFLEEISDRPGPATKASIFRHPPAVLTRKRPMALLQLEVSQTAPEKGDMSDHRRKGLLSLW